MREWYFKNKCNVPVIKHGFEPALYVVGQEPNTDGIRSVCLILWCIFQNGESMWEAKSVETWTERE